MKRHLYILFCLALLVSCDDGDIFTIDLDFEGELERCENDIDSYIIYDTRDDPNEALLLIIERDDANELLFTTPTITDVPTELDIDEEETYFIFRSYSRALEDDELCDIIPPGDLVITDDDSADSGTVYVTTTVEDDDNDGLSNEYEGLSGEASADGIYWDSLDSDEDGFPDYIDQDDDNDNVLTIYEIDTDELDDDGDPTNILDTDEDDIPDYLDDDDDGDGVDTRLEDLSAAGKDPRAFDNYVTNEEGIDIYRYLYNYNDGITNANEEFEDSGFIYNTYTRSATTSFIIENAGFTIISTNYIDFGDFENSFDITNEPEDDDDDEDEDEDEDED